MISPQLLPLRLRHRPQLAAGAAEGHGDARIEHVAQLAEDARHCSSPLSATSAIAARARGGGGRYGKGQRKQDR